MSGRPRKLPEREEVVRLYVEEGLGTPQIARMFNVSDPRTVRVQLLAAGVKLRKCGGWGRPLKCIECGEPVERVWHPGFKCWYGRRCKDHQRLHRTKVCSDFAKRFRASNPEVLKKRYDKWAGQLKSMSFGELLQEIKDNPCQIKKAELLRKMRKLQRMGRAEEAITLAQKAYPTLVPKLESLGPTL